MRHLSGRSKERHRHGPHCGHLAILHNGHVDYLQDGHLHHPRPDSGKVDEHRLEINASNPDGCTGSLLGKGHSFGHIHGPGCGHEPVPHGGHIDYIVNERLHHPHGDHCDDHGPIQVPEVNPADLIPPPPVESLDGK